VNYVSHPDSLVLVLFTVWCAWWWASHWSWYNVFSVKQNPKPTYTVYIRNQYRRWCFLSQVWSLYGRITVTQWPIMLPILHCPVHLSLIFKKILVVTFNVVTGVW